MRNGDGEVHRSDLERLYIRFKEAEASNQLRAHRKGRKKKGKEMIILSIFSKV